MIGQIPTRVYSVTLGRSRTIRCSVGTYSFHHCQQEFFVGYHYVKTYLKLASPEKALVDYFYFSPTKHRQFSHLPEMDLPQRFSWPKAIKFCDKMLSPGRKTLVLSKIHQLRKSIE